MFKYILAAVLVSVVSGCVTSDGQGPYSKSSAARSAPVRQTAQATDKAARSPEAGRTQLIMGAAY
jgi:Flp pilus assembly protein TadD